ncbi:MAG: DNA-processing protein DprA [Veillonellaceae bacterium]|nr:DNA-processing protein DprA [Veillonellaceae bacterium]
MEEVYAAGLQKAASLGAVRIRRLAEHFGTFRAIWEASADELRAAQILGPKQLEKFLAARREIRPEEEYEKNCRLGIRFLTYRDAAYPQELRECHNAPAILAYRGNWPPAERRLAMVGSRKPTAYGVNASQWFAAELAAQGVVIVSGGARGIDSVCHEAALQRGTTVCVLACGLDIAYPPENRRLFDRIAEQGVLLTEYALGTKPLGRQFPARNRIISGLSRGVLVMEAACKSGSLITADFALEEGRDVFALPGSIFSKQSGGTNRLLRQGAIPLTEPQDVLLEYGWDTGVAEQEEEVLALTAEEELVYRCCRLEEAVDVDTIILHSTYDPVKVNFILLQLELKGIVKNIGNQQYVAVVRG